MQVQERPVSVSDDVDAEPFGLAAAIAGFLGADLPIAIECYDGSRLGPPDAPTRIVVRSPKALRYVLTAPGEIGFARAYVAGEIDVEGDIFDALLLRDHLPDVKVTPREWLALARTVGVDGLRPLPPPPEESARARPPAQQGARRGRDRAPLRRVERLLPARPRTVDDVLVRGVRRAPTRRSKPRRRPSTSSSAASSVCVPGCACSTSAAAGAAW